jgi:hypothetical protein
MPTEIHQHYDAEGNYTGHTVITRESPWDDETRDRALRLHQYESNLCGCGCGQPVVETYGKQQVYKVDKFTCLAGRALAMAKREDDKEAEREKRPEGWKDGLHYYVEPIDRQEVERGD